MTDRVAVSRAAQLEQHWHRFVDWCAAWDRTPLPASESTIQEFLDLFPGAPATQRLRLQAIRSHHHTAGFPDPSPPALAMRVWAPRDSADAVEQLLKTIPKYRFPDGVRGRRDGFLVVLLGVLGMTRQQAREIVPDDIELGEQLAIRGQVLRSSGDPAGCCACAVTRWLRVVGPVWGGFRGEVFRLVDPTTGSLTVHDCRQPIVGEWRRAEQLLLPLDVHGWARTGVSLSARSISAIMPGRLAAADRDAPLERVGPAIRQPGRFDDLTAAETYEVLGDADAAVDAALARLAALQQDVTRLADVIDTARRNPSGYRS
jgi:hypothetical protein